MRFLVDQNLSPTVATALQDAGHDAAHVRDLGLARASDGEILDRAASEHRVVVSADTDFGSILAQRRATGPSVILIRRTASRRARDITQLLTENLGKVTEELDEGAVVVFESTRLRVRRLPLV